MKNCGVKRRKLDGLDASDKVDFGDLRSSNDSFEFFKIHIWMIQLPE